MNQSSTCLSGLKVVDLGFGMAAALVARFLRNEGADVTRIELPGEDPFYSVYPAYGLWRQGATFDRESGASAARLESLFAGADICIVGGEDYPGFAKRYDASQIQSRHPGLVVLAIDGYPKDSIHAGRPATDLLVQARSGLAFEHYTNRPLLMAFEPCNYGAALRGILGILAAILQRESTARGQLVSTSLFEGALSWPLVLWFETEKRTPVSNFVLPKDPWPLIFRCADGVWIQIVIGSAGSKGRIYQILHIDDPTVDIHDSGMPSHSAEGKNFFGDVDLLADHVKNFSSEDLLNALWAAGLPADLVLPPGGCWDDAQVRHNGIIAEGAHGDRHVAHPIQMRLSPAQRRETPKNVARPLQGMKVVDFGTFIAGPYSATILVDLGAHVTKIEPLQGDPNRALFRAYAAVNRGKDEVTIDMKTPEGLKIAQDLCVAADIVTSNFRPGVSTRLGIDAATLQKLKPELIVLEISSYGSTGPRADGAGFDMCLQALCGHGWRGGGIDNPPLWNRTTMTDFTAALLGAIGVLLALFNRARTGAGAAIEVNLLNAGLYLLSDLIKHPDGRFEGAARLNREQTGFHPAEGLYETADGWLAIVARDDATAQSLVSVLNLEESITAPREVWNADTRDRIANAIRTKTIAELIPRLERAGVWVESCCTNGEHSTLVDPSLVALGTVYTTHHPKFGEVRQIGPLTRLSGSDPVAPRHAPRPGEHTEQVLAGLGFTPAEVQDLRQRAVVR